MENCAIHMCSENHSIETAVEVEVSIEVLLSVTEKYKKGILNQVLCIKNLLLPDYIVYIYHLLHFLCCILY
jgi:hypothetical protein